MGGVGCKRGRVQSDLAKAAILPRVPPSASLASNTLQDTAKQLVHHLFGFVLCQVLPYVVRGKFWGTMEGKQVDIGAWAWTSLNMWVLLTKYVSTHTEATLDEADEWLRRLMACLAGPWAPYQTSGFAFVKFHLLTHIRKQIRYQLACSYV